MEEQKKEPVLTEVTSIAQEEARTGEKIAVPTPDIMYARANAAFIANMRKQKEIFKTLTSRQKARVHDAVLDLPQENLPVTLKSNEERLAFIYGQQALAARFLIMQHHINQQIQENNTKAKQVDKEKMVKDFMDNMGKTEENKEVNNESK